MASISFTPPPIYPILFSKLLSYLPMTSGSYGLSACLAFFFSFLAFVTDTRIVLVMDLHLDTDTDTDSDADTDTDNLDRRT